MSARWITVGVAVFGLLTAAGSVAHAAQAPEPAKPVNAATFFTGRWYEIGRDPQKLTDGCVAGTTDYDPDGKGGVFDHDACHDQTPQGKAKLLGGPLTILNPGQNTKIHITYQLFGLIPIGRTYWAGSSRPTQASPTSTSTPATRARPRP
jgi:apolipoprotein D and lipocalin family protein